MTNSELKLNRSGDVDHLHYQRLAEQARAEAVHALLVAAGRKMKKLATFCIVRIRNLPLLRLLPGTTVHHVH